MELRIQTHSKLEFVTRQMLLWRKLEFMKNTDSGRRNPKSVLRIAEQLVEGLWMVS